MTRCYEVYMILCPSSWHHAHIVIQSQHIQLYRYNHTHTSIHIQPCNDVALRYVTHSHGVMQAQTHNVLVFTLQTFMNLRQATKMNSYTRNHCGLHVVTSCIWTYMVLWSPCKHHTRIVTQSYKYNHTNTIIQIQSCTYNHAMVLHAKKWIRALESIIHIQCAIAHGVYLGVDVFIPAGNRITYGFSASNHRELIQTQPC